MSLSPPRTNCAGLTVTSERSDGKSLTDPFSVGTTTITWVATDTSGHTALCNQQITVIAATANTIEGTVTQHLDGVITPPFSAAIAVIGLNVEPVG